MRAKPVILIDIVKEKSVSKIARRVREGVGPLFNESLDKAFGFAVSLRSVGFGEAVFDIQFSAGEGKGM